MPSIARITKQYAKTKQRGGGLFGIGDDKPAEAQAATPAVTPAATPAQPAAEPKSAEPTASQEPSFLDKIFKPTPEDKDAQIVPEGKTTEPGAAAVAEPLETEAEETADASADGEKQGKDESALDKLKKLFIGNKKEDEESEESESEESGSEESESEESGSENAVPAPAAALTAAAATTATANVISESESESESDASDDEQDELTFKNFEREIQTLRDKYDKLKEENRRLKSEKKDESNGKKDNSEFSKIIASFFAIEGSVAQLKLSLKKHADQNGFPVDGLGLDDAESELPSEPTPAPELEQVAAPEAEVPPPQDNNAALAAGAGAATAMAAAPIVADQLAATSTEASAEMPAAGIPNEMMNNAPEAAPAIPELDSSSESGSDSGSESDLEEIPVNQEQHQSTATAGAAGAADITGMPAALEQPVVGESMPAEPATAPVATAASGPSPVPAPGATDANNGLFSGGKNHYLQSMKKNKTHRHHKRRNRHQTLRK